MTRNKIRLYTVDEVAKIMDVSPPTIYRWIRAKHLHAVKPGQRWIITDADLREVLGPTWGRDEDV